MKFAILIISLCLARTFSDESPNCYVIETERCDDSLLPTELPDTIEELMRDCKNILTLVKCMARAEELCYQDSTFRNMYSYLNSSCQEDSHIFKVVARNFDCIMSSIVNLEDRCRRSDIGMQSYVTIKTKVEELGGSEKRELLSCIPSFSEATCKSTLLGEECGDESERALVEFMANTSTIFGMCVQKFPEEWEALYEVLQTVVREEHQIENALKENMMAS